MTPHEHDEDFTWEENAAFADIVCSAYQGDEIEYLEEYAEKYFSFLDDHHGWAVWFDEGEENIERGNE